mmetsp:Transcript_136031/g.435092  ORF Transcript_136031/g.435092 Transcript_136031/m.435092 type:complete len:283 (-) Transcript_136031:8-856(-)
MAELLQDGDHVVRCTCVEPARRLVEEGDLGVRDELRADGGALALAAGDALDQLVAHHGVRALDQTQRQQQVLDELIPGGARGGAQPQTGGEVEDLARRHGAQEGVVLHDVTKQLLHPRRVDDFAVDLHLARDLSAVLAPLPHTAGEQIQQAGLAGAGGSQDASELPWQQLPGHALQDLLAPRLLGSDREAQALPAQVRGLLVAVDEGEDLDGVGLPRHAPLWRRCLWQLLLRRHFEDVLHRHCVDTGAVGEATNLALSEGPAHARRCRQQRWEEAWLRSARR